MSKEKGNKNLPDKPKHENNKNWDKPVHEKFNWDSGKGNAENKSPGKKDRGITDIGPQKNNESKK